MSSQENKPYWPDETRLKMIEKSEFYPEQEKVYQYGYYDGFQEYHKNHTTHLQARIAELEKENRDLKSSHTIMQNKYTKMAKTYQNFDVEKLIAENERLRADNLKLKSDTDRRIKGYNDLHDDLIGYRDKYDQSVQDLYELKAENKKLREALEYAIKALSVVTSSVIQKSILPKLKEVLKEVGDEDR